MSMKNCNDTIGNRTRDLPACSLVPQPTVPPRAPYFLYIAVLIMMKSRRMRREEPVVRMGGEVIQGVSGRI